MLRITIASLLVVTVLQAEHIKVFFADGFKDEQSIMQPFQQWYSGSSDNKYTLEELYKDGWTLSNVTKVNASAVTWQMSFFMEISDKKYAKVKSKYEIKKKKKIKQNKAVSAEDGL